ncbi:MAG: YceD family protein [Solirubrobacterales bacterium]
MPATPRQVDLARLSLSSGQAQTLDVELSLEPVSFGGQEYRPAERTESRVDVSRTTTGYALRLRFSGELAGPCTRCLEPARLGVDVDAREVDQPATDDEELRSPYVSDEALDLARWANDAFVLALPSKLLCRSDCAGLCPVCGESLNDADPDAHKHETGGDPRMAKLKELKLD